MNKHLFTWLLIGALGAFLGCRSEGFMLENVDPSSIRSISVRDLTGHTATIRDEQTIAAIVRYASSLRAYKEGKITPELTLTIEFADGRVEKLRMDRICIGPDVPASAVVTRWYFTDDWLYQLFRSKLETDGKR